MEAKNLNVIINSFLNVFESVLSVKPQKKNLEKLEMLETQMQNIIYFSLGGDFNGFFTINFNDEAVLEIANRMMGGMVTFSEVNEMAISCVEELGGMIKGDVINRFASKKINCDITKVDLLKPSEIAPIPDTLLKVNSSSEIGEIELTFLVNKS